MTERPYLHHLRTYFCTVASTMFLTDFNHDITTRNTATFMGKNQAHVDEDYGQLEAIDNDNVDTYPVVFPCVLINTDSVDWSSLSDKSQKGNAHICVRLCIDCYADTHFGSGTTDKIKERSSLVHRLHESLQTYRPLAVGAFVRTKSKFYAWFQLRLMWE